MIERKTFEAGTTEKYEGVVFDFRVIDFMNQMRFRKENHEVLAIDGNIFKDKIFNEQLTH